MMACAAPSRRLHDACCLVLLVIVLSCTCTLAEARSYLVTPSKPLHAWSSVEVGHWLTRGGFGQYARIARQHNIDGHMLANDMLSTKEWQRLGVKPVGDIVLIRSMAASLLANTEDIGAPHLVPAPIVHRRQPSPAPTPTTPASYHPLYTVPFPELLELIPQQANHNLASDASAVDSLGNTVELPAEPQGAPIAHLPAPWIGAVRRSGWHRPDVLAMYTMRDADGNELVSNTIPPLRPAATLHLPSAHPPDSLQPGPEQAAFYEYYLPMEMLHRGVPFIDYAGTQGLDADAAAELYIRGYNVEATGMLQSNVLTTQVISTVGMAAAFGLGIHSVHTRGDWASLNVNRLIHNRDQLEYLVESGRLRAPVFRELLANYTAVYEHEEATREAVGRNRTTSFVPTAAQVVYIGTSLGRFLYRPPDPPLRELPPELLHPLNPANDWAAIEQEYLSGHPGIVVVDNVLTPQALSNLRELATASTVMGSTRTATHRAQLPYTLPPSLSPRSVTQTYFDTRPSYIGAYWQNGFGNRVLFRLVEALRRAMPRVLGNLTITEMWSYKYYDQGPGIGKHCDNALVNINGWLTPDEANLDPDTGGLVVYKAIPPRGIRWMDVNSNLGMQRLEELAASADAVRVPHRQNRFVIFDSELIHESDTFTFKPGYLNRRINLTLLYGQQRWSRTTDQ